MPKIHLRWYRDPVPHVVIENGWTRGYERAVLSRLLVRAAERGLIPNETLELVNDLWYELTPDVLLLPLKEERAGGLRPEVAAFVRTHLRLAPPELLALVRGEPADLSRYTATYRRTLHAEAERWQAFLSGKTNALPGFFDLVITPGTELERWLDLVVTSPLLPRALQEVREKVEERRKQRAERARIQSLEERYAIRLAWTPVRRFPAGSSQSYEATVEGTSGGRRFTARFEVSARGLAVRLPEGTVYRDPKGTWRWAEDHRPLEDHVLQAFLDTAYARMPKNLGG